MNTIYCILHRLQVAVSGVAGPAVAQGPAVLHTFGVGKCRCESSSSHWSEPSLRCFYQAAQREKAEASGEQHKDGRVVCQLW